LKRSGFARKVYVPPPAPPVTRATRRSVIAVCSAMSAQVDKDRPISHEGYRRLVASLPCITHRSVI
jgi:hypothetical protein